MKTVTTNLVLIISLSVITLTGCSSNTQQQNTGIGAVSGAVIGGVAGSAIGAGTGRAVAIGVGAVAGALFGGYVGKSMDSSDNTAMNSSLEHNPAYKTSTWRNSRTGATVSMTPTSNRMTYKGYSNCRKFTSTAVVNGRKQIVHGIACRGQNGLWRTVARKH